MATLAFDVGIANMALCVAENGLARYCCVFSIGKPKDPLAVLIANLQKQLRQQQQLIGEVQHVRVEQQLGRAATKNFALSAVLLAHYNALCEDVQFVNPRKKFKVLASLPNVPGISEKSEQFRTTRGPALKKLSVQAATALAQHAGDEYLQEMLASMKKQDDLGDCYCMALLC